MPILGVINSGGSDGVVAQRLGLVRLQGDGGELGVGYLDAGRVVLFDWLGDHGQAGTSFTRRLVWAMRCAARFVEMGTGITGFAVGDRVTLNPIAARLSGTCRYYRAGLLRRPRGAGQRGRRRLRPVLDGPSGDPVPGAGLHRFRAERAAGLVYPAVVEITGISRTSWSW